MKKYLKALACALVTEICLVVGCACSFICLTWYSLLLYGIFHPMLFFFYWREQHSVDSMWDTLFSHFIVLTSINVFVLSLAWYFKFDFCLSVARRLGFRQKQ
jgi:hypothetical protein